MAIVNSFRKTPDIYPLHEIRVVDGDTLEARIALPFGQSVVKRIRLKGWWADETDGIYGLQGKVAALTLQNWLSGKAVWLHAPSCRLDKYGRVVGHLLHGSQLVNPKEVLGIYQLTEKEHNSRRAQSLAARKQGTAGLAHLGGVPIADTESKRPINDPRAIFGDDSDLAIDDREFSGSDLPFGQSPKSPASRPECS